MAHAKICILKKCANPTFGRLRDAVNITRRDLCEYHFFLTLRHFNMKKPSVFIVEIWGKEATINEDRTDYELA